MTTNLFSGVKYGLNIKDFYVLCCVCILCIVSVWVCEYECSFHCGQKRATDALELELHRVGCHRAQMVAKLGYWKSSSCF